MTTFFNKLNKPCFGPIFGPFSQFFGQKIFPQKSGSVTHNFIWVSSTCQSLEKNKDTIQKKRPDRLKDGRTNGRMEGRTEPIL